MRQENSREDWLALTDALTQQMTAGLTSASQLLNQLRTETEQIKVNNEGLRVNLERIKEDVQTLNRLVQGNGSPPLSSRLSKLEVSNKYVQEFLKDYKTKKNQITLALFAGIVGALFGLLSPIVSWILKG